MTSLGGGGSKIPPGVILPYGGATAPDGWILCDGSAQDATADPKLQPLFDIIGNTFGGADNSDFQVPDLRGRLPLGKDNMGGSAANRVTNAQADSVGGAAGAENHTLTEAEMPSHTHDQQAETFLKGVASPTVRMATTTPNDDALGGTTQAAGSGNAHNNMPPYLTLNYIIKK